MAREYTLDDVELWLLGVMEDRRMGLAAEAVRAAATALSWPFAAAAGTRLAKHAR